MISWRYFSFWYSTFANGGEPRYVLLEDKANYIFTKKIAQEGGSIKEGYDLAREVLEIWNRQRPKKV